MASLRKWSWIAILAAALVLPAGLVITANLEALQQDDNPPGPVLGPATSIPGVVPPAIETDRDPDLRNLEERQALARNAERQKELVNDTDKLLALATELKSEVSKSNKDTLSIEVIKKAAEIEKLAKNVQQKMKAE